VSRRPIELNKLRSFTPERFGAQTRSYSFTFNPTSRREVDSCRLRDRLHDGQGVRCKD